MIKSISIIIPTYKEEKRIDATLKRIISYFSKRDVAYEILIIDDNSPDGTIEIAKSYGEKIRTITNKRRLGKGASVRIGVENATYPIILMTDADLSTPIEEVQKLFLHGGDLVIGSRRAKDSIIKKAQGKKRILFGKVFSLATRLILGISIKDTQCGFKLMKKKVAMDVFSRQKIPGFSFDAEMIFIAKKLGYSIKEIGIVWIDNPEESKINPVKDGIRMFFDLVRIRMFWAAGFYK